MSEQSNEFNPDLFSTATEMGTADGPNGAPEDEDIVLNLTGDDLKTRRTTPLPVGTRLKVRVYEASIGYVKKEGDNKGKPFYKIQFKPLPDEIEKHGLSDKKLFFENMMLFSGAFFDAANFLRALGYSPGDPTAKEVTFKAPHPNKLLGQELEVKVTKHEASNRLDDEGNPFMNEALGGFRPIQEPSDGTVSEEVADLFSTGGANTNFA